MALPDKLNRLKGDKIARLLDTLEGRACRAVEMPSAQPRQQVIFPDLAPPESDAPRPPAPQYAPGDVPLSRFFPDAVRVMNTEGGCSLRRVALPLPGERRLRPAEPLAAMDQCLFPLHTQLSAPVEGLARAAASMLELEPGGAPSGEPLRAEDVLFVDIETTGLMGSAGIYPFLIGVGQIDLKGGAFVVEQLFMEDYDQERAQLVALAERLAAARAIVTFNGRTFDVPLLQNRLIFHRMNRRVFDMPHADLLHPARRFWRRRFPSCSLQSLEVELFGLRRVGDVPGELIPQIYQDYARGQRPESIVPVLTHNVQDVVTMAGLLLLMGGVMDAGENLPDGCGHELLGLARMLHRRGDRERALACRERAVGNLVERDLQFKAMFDLGWDYKRLERWREALETFESVARVAPPDLALAAHEERAKILEHQLRDFDGARRAVEDALELLRHHRELSRYTAAATGDAPDPWTMWRDALEHRRARLDGKLSRLIKEKGRSS